MTILRSRKDRENPFVQINRNVFQDPKISLKAKGLIGYCLSKPDDWIFHISVMEKELGCKKDAIRSALRELTDNGYCFRAQFRTEDGTYGRWETIISDSKEEILRAREEFKKCLPQVDFPLPVFPLPENPPLHIKIEQKREETKNTPTPTSSSKTKKEAAPPSEIASRLAEYFSSSFKSKILETHQPDKFNPKSKAWSPAIFDGLLKSYSEQELMKIIDFAHCDDFWKALVHSPAYLKKKALTLRLVMNRPKATYKPNGFDPNRHIESFSERNYNIIRAEEFQ
jgi:hypothetical protein